MPVFFSLRLAVCSGAWIFVVYEGDVVTNKNIVFNGHPLADEGMAGDLAIFADFNALLNFNECANLRIVADLAAV